MVNEQVNPPHPAGLPDGRGRSDQRFFAVFVLILAAVMGGYFVLRTTPQNGQAQDTDGDNAPPSPYFRGWKKPDLAIVVTGEMHGYTQPCRCSTPQKRGLVRRYKF